MANPTPIYRVKFNGEFLPGYLQTEPQTLSMRISNLDILNRNGGIVGQHGANVKDITLDFRILSRLDSGTGLEHLNDCKDQYYEALSILARVNVPAPLYIGDQTKYLTALFSQANADFNAGESRRISYSAKFQANPFFYDDTAVTDSITGNGTLNMTLPDTRETYPVISIPAGVTAVTISHAASGKSIDFIRGSFSGTVVIDCGTFSVLDGSVDASSTMNNVNFGIKHTTGAGTFSLVTTGFTGTGTIGVSVTPRYELNI